MKNINGFQKLALGSFLAVSAFWLYLFTSHHNSGSLNYWFSFLFGLIPLFGGLVGVLRAKLWGGLKSKIGKAVFFFSLGLALWGFGESIWSYYNFFKHVPAPYPSLADIGFAPSIFFWVLGAAYMSVATGALFALRKSHWAKFIALLIPLFLLVPSYYIQVKLARGGVVVPQGETVLKAVLDIAYPFGDFLALTFAAVVYLLSYKYFGGIYRFAVICLLVGLAMMYIGDSIFSYTTTKGLYYNADWGDEILALGQFLLTFGILAFATTPKIGHSASTPKD